MWVIETAFDSEDRPLSAADFRQGVGEEQGKKLTWKKRRPPLYTE